MASEQAERIRAEMFAERNAPLKPLSERREAWRERARQRVLPDGTSVEAVDMAGVPAEWVRHPEADGEGVVLFVHGGGYVSGSRETHRHLAAYLSMASNARVLVPDYRLAPEFPFPVGVQDVIAVYGAILREGVPAENIIVSGDSAGGGLALAALIALRDAAAPLPAASVLISPWTDLTLSGGSYESRAEVDPNCRVQGLEEAAQMYAGSNPPDHPLISPMFAHLGELPPMLVHAGDHEMLLDDSVYLAKRARAAGVDVSIKVWPEMWHVFHIEVPEMPEAVEALEAIGAYMRDKVGRRTPTAVV